MSAAEPVFLAPAPARTPAVVDGELHHVSASQIKTFVECPRRWWWQNVRGFRAPETASQGLGKRVHAVLEDWARASEPRTPSGTKEAEIAATGLWALPRHGPWLRAESSLEDPPIKLRGVPVHGFVDLHHAPVLAPAGRSALYLAPGYTRHLNTTGMPVVIDHKTTKDWRYVKTKDELVQDPQVVIYARWAIERYLGGHYNDRAHVRFVYYLTGRGAGVEPARAVDVSLTYQDTFASWSKFEEIVSEMSRLARCDADLDLAKVDANWGACDQYGGCPHRARCARDTTGLVTVESVLARLRAPGAEVMGAKGASKKSSVPESVSVDGESEGTSGDAGFFSAFLEGANSQFAEEPAPALELYVSCLPVRGFDTGEVQFLDAILEERASKICAAEGVADLSLIPFGKGKGLLAASLRAQPPRGVVIARQGPLTDIALEVLRPMAGVLIEGVR